MPLIQLLNFALHVENLLYTEKSFTFCISSLTSVE